jgi:succinate dehydrogenase/fumarate reductase flavoprotein subunit
MTDAAVGNATPVDLLVLGGGMAGLSAAAFAARHGARVVLVEKAAAVGGSAALAGYVWTARTPEVLAEIMPQGDPELGRVLVEGVGGGVDWIRSLGVECGDPVTVMGYGRGCQVDMQQYIRACEAAVRRAPGCRVLTSTTAVALLRTGGAVAGARLRAGDGTEEIVPARWTLLATGGFQNDPGLTGQHIHPRAAGIPRRTNPHSAGDGLRLGLDAGAAFGKAGAGFYGHLVPYPVSLTDPASFVELSLYYSEHGLLVNQDGRRFVDETVADHISTQAVLRQPNGRALLIADERVRREWIMAAYVDGLQPVDKLAVVRRAGGRVALAEDLDELAYLPDDWGYDATAVVETVRAFNAGASNGGTVLDPSRVNDAAPLDEPPYYVVEAQPAITSTQCGLLIDTCARVLDEVGAPIDGLLSAGGDSGGTFVHGYAGGLALALVFGLQAARLALAV